MAFNLQRFSRVSLADNTGLIVLQDSSLVNAPAYYTYASASDAVATISAADYFNAESVIYDLKVNDIIMCVGSDANIFLMVDTVDTTTSPKTITTVEFTAAGVVDTANIAASAVTTVKIAAANVTLAKLASGITPSHVVKYAAQVTTSGGSASEALTVAGVVATDLVFIQVKNDGTNNRTVLAAAATLNTITITFSGDPGADLVLYYQVLRAAS